ncbi:MAG: YdcF family protein [Cytophagaceae bacterium]|nr:YdcF family protein [Cytophagaceae bacterium]
MRTRTITYPRSQPLTWVPVVKRGIKVTVVVVFFGLVIVLCCNWWVLKVTEPRNYYQLQQLPPTDVALVLGTSKSIVGGQENLFFRYRMEAAARLYREGKVKRLILSGNNDSVYYNEPYDMRDALLKLGIPREVMKLDFAGRRTYDSVVRCREIFRENRVTIVSQPFHNARALFVAESLGLDAVAFAAQDVPNGYSLKTLLREYLARPKAMVDLYLISPTTEHRNQAISRRK